MTKRKQRVLFLCTGNSARSQMSEAILRSLAHERFEVHSAGLSPRPIHPYTFQVMEEVGLDLAGQSSKSLGRYLGKIPFDHVISVCSQAEESCPRLWLGTPKVVHWAFQDPAACEGTEERKLAAFREIRSQIDQRIRAWLRDFDAIAGAD